MEPKDGMKGDEGAAADGHGRGRTGHHVMMPPPWFGSLWQIERMAVNLSKRLGEIRDRLAEVHPGDAGGDVPKVPRISAGASGFGSNVS